MITEYLVQRKDSRHLLKWLTRNEGWTNRIERARKFQNFLDAQTALRGRAGEIVLLDLLLYDTHTGEHYVIDDLPHAATSAEEHTKYPRGRYRERRGAKSKLSDPASRPGLDGRRISAEITLQQIRWSDDQMWLQRIMMDKDQPPTFRTAAQKRLRALGRRKPRL